MAQKPTYIDLFSWAWWFSLWFDNQWFKNIFSIDYEKSFCDTYRKNFPSHTLIEKDICKISEHEIRKLVNWIDIDVIIWWPPCQWFSMAGSIWRNFIDDPRNHLFIEFVRIVSIVQPKFFIMENVARLYTHNGWSTRKEIIKKFNDIWYNVEVRVLNTVDFWIPQKRQRVIFLWTKLNIKIDFPIWNIKKHKTIKDAIWHLPKLKPWDSSTIKNHEAMNHSEQMLKKMAHIWDWWGRDQIPSEMRPKSWDIRKYIRYKSDEPSICITGDMRKVFHYSQNRALSVRELSAIQSFPDDFEFLWSKISQQQQVGNSVPPIFAEVLASHIKKLSKQMKYDNRKLPKVNYIGNKEKLTEWIISNIPSEVWSIFDAFSWWCSIGYECKRQWLRVFSNDILEVNYHLAKVLIENQSEMLDDNDLKIIFSWKPIKWFMYKHYTNKFFYDYECMELDQYRGNIKKLDNEYKQSLALSLMRRAMIRKMPYSRFNINWEKIIELRDEELSYQKYKRKRAYHNQSFKHHFLENLEEYNNAVFDNWRKNLAYNDDVFSIIDKIKADAIYLDPPYTWTMNNYHWFYGVIDDYIKWVITKPFKNNFINKEQSILLFDKLFSKLWKIKYRILSYNNWSYPDKDSLISIIKKYSKNISVIEKEHAYQITWKNNKNKNIEYLFIVKNTK